MTKFTNRKEIRYVCGNRLGFHIFIISACSRNVKYSLTKIRSCARQLFARCRRGDSRARRRTCSPYKPPSKWQTPPDLSLRGGRRPTWRPEREARGSALGVQSREGTCSSYRLTIKTYKPIASVAALSERLAHLQVLRYKFIGARPPSLSFRGAKRRGNLAVPAGAWESYRRNRNCLPEIATSAYGLLAMTIRGCIPY